MNAVIVTTELHEGMEGDNRGTSDTRLFLKLGRSGLTGGLVRGQGFIYMDI